MSNEHQKTIPWIPSEYITLHQNGHSLHLCYRATKAGISCVVLPAGWSMTIGELQKWADEHGWGLRWPATVHIDIGLM